MGASRDERDGPNRREERKIRDLVFGEGEGGADEGGERVSCEPSQSSLAGRTHLAERKTVGTREGSTTSPILPSISF